MTLQVHNIVAMVRRPKQVQRITKLEHFSKAGADQRSPHKLRALATYATFAVAGHHQVQAAFVTFFGAEEGGREFE